MMTVLLLNTLKIRVVGSIYIELLEPPTNIQGA